MSRQQHLERSIRDSFDIIGQYEDIIRTSNQPEEKARARRLIGDQCDLIEGYLSEFRALSGGTLPKDLNQIAISVSNWRARLAAASRRSGGAMAPPSLVPTRRVPVTAWLLPLVVAVCLLLVYILWPKTKPMPNVIGWPVAAAQAQLVAKGLGVGTTVTEASETVEEGFVIRSDPVAGVRLKRGERVILYVSARPGDVLVAELSVSSTEITQGQSVTITWVVTNADSVVLQPFGTVDSAGEKVDWPQQTETYTLIATNKAETVEKVQEVVVNPPVIGAPQVTFSVDPSTIVKGCVQTVNLKWETKDADKVTIEPDLGEVGLAGFRGVDAPTANTMYTLVAKGPGGTVTRQVQVEVEEPLCHIVPEELNLRSGPGTVYEPPIATLSRSTELRALGFYPGGFPKSGDPEPEWIMVQVVTSGQEGWVRFKTEYVKCNFESRCLQKATAPPTPTPILPPTIEFFRADPDAITAGGCTNLEWGTVTNATTVTINQGIGGVPATPGSRQVCPTQTTSYVMTVTGPGGTTTASTTVMVPPTPMPPPLPDLVVEIVSIDKTSIVYAEQPWTWVHYRVGNVGTGPTPSGSIYLSAWVNGSPTSGYMTVDGPIQPGAAVDKEFAVGHDSGWPVGSYAVQVEVDYRKEIEESKENNNLSNSISFVVLPPPPTPTLLAHYPLTSNAQDVTGNNMPMTLQQVSFQDGGIYCSGIAYDVATTPHLSELDYHSLSIVADFKVSERKRMPVFMDYDYRAFGFYLDSDGNVELKYNNNNYTECSLIYQLNTWHTAIITYDGNVGRLYMDGNIGCEVKFEIDYGNIKKITTGDYSNAKTFKGVLRDLKVYNGVIVPGNP